MKSAYIRLALHLTLLVVLVGSSGRSFDVVVRSLADVPSTITGGVTQVFAQTEDRATSIEPNSELVLRAGGTPEATPEATTVPVNTIFIKPQQSEQIKSLVKLYQDQVEKYTKSEREYRTAKAQFAKLSTLQSLEEAIVKTKQAMIDRDDVLITYCELVRAHLQDAQGVEITLKTQADTELETQILELKAHREKVTTTTDREGVAERAQEFVVISEPFFSRANRAVTLISLGSLQSIYDRSVLVYAEIKIYHKETPTSAIRQEERLRAYKQVDNSIENLRQLLEEQRLQVSQSKTGTTSNMRDKFSAIYAGDSKLLEYLHELLLELT